MTARNLIPYLTIDGADAAINFYIAAFAATEVFRMSDPADGKVGHAELKIGDSSIYLADEYPDFAALGPDTIGGSPVLLHLSSDQVDQDVARAVDAGATVLRAPANQSFGERCATILDPFGHRWMLSQKFEELTQEEAQRRWEAAT